MKAVIAEQYGGVEVLELNDDLPVPRVGPNGVLVKVHAASVNPVDWKLRQGLLDAVRPVVFPVIWGCDLSGVVTEVGPSVTLFKPGDEVYGMKDGYVAKTYRGTYAEYVVVPEKSLAAKPKALSHEEAAAVPLAALTAWQAMVNQGRLKPGQRVLIHAGAGGVGVMAIQIAKAFGAYVAATAGTSNQDLLRELGADLPIDYTGEKIGKVRPKFDLVLDGVGESVWAESFRALKIGGRLVTLTPPIPEQSSGKVKFFATAIRGIGFGVVRGLLGGKRLAITQVKPRGGELEKISALIEAGNIRPVIEKVFALEQIVEAHRLSEKGHVRGKLVISIQQSASAVSAQP
ncbi:MAG TPA: NADP-dependent oxidoreductase [Candidatus Angelobacter sp.]|jgi:NADPH:quinone reductase-like Zn-dependent oxidoreductase